MSKIFKKLGKGKIVFPKNFDWPREPFVVLDCGGSPIIIEKEVTFSSGVYVLTHTHQFDKAKWRDLKKVQNSNPTIFRRCCFIGINAIILYKCKLVGEYSIVAAGSVVTKSIPDHEIWAGNPAKKIGEVEKI